VNDGIGKGDALLW